MFLEQNDIYDKEILRVFVGGSYARYHELKKNIKNAEEKAVTERSIRAIIKNIFDLLF